MLRRSKSAKSERSCSCVPDWMKRANGWARLTRKSKKHTKRASRRSHRA